MQIVCFGIERAIAHLEKSNDNIAQHLIQVLKDHASDGEINLFMEDGQIIHMTFVSTHKVDAEIEIDDTVIKLYESEGLTYAAVTHNQPIINSKEKTMNAQAQAQTTIPPVYSAEERDALLAKMATMQAAMDEMAKVKQQASPKATPAPAAYSGLATKIGKGVLYAGGAVVVGAAGFWAWKKWGSSSSASA